MGSGQTLRMIRRRWLLFVSVVLLCLLAGGLVTLRTQKAYGATSTLFVSVVLPNDPAALAATNTFVTARVQSYVSLATTPGVTDAVVAQLHLPFSSAALGSRITADAPLNKVLINIRVTDSSASRAALIANAVADRFVVVVGDLEKTAVATTSPVKVTVIQPATASRTPLRPRVKLNLTLALLAGLLLAFAAVKVRDSVDDPVQRPEDLEAASGRPLLSVLPGGRTGLAGRLSRTDRALTARAAVALADNLDHLGHQGSLGVVAVTSLTPGEGKTFVAVALARRLGDSGTRVCLVDANLRAPSVAARLGLRPNRGLTSVLDGTEPPEAYLQKVSEALFAMPAGPRPPNPAAVLGLRTTREVVAGLARAFPVTLLDTAALAPHPDGLGGSRLAQGVVLVVSAHGGSRRQQVTKAVSVLEAAGVAVLGVVLNNASHRDAARYLGQFAVEPAGTPTVLAER